MILRSIRLEGLGRFRNPVELAGLGVGVHVVHGPNETGKSTLCTAVARALCDKYSTRGAEIEELRPWGTSLSPTVTLEIDVAGTRYRLRKRFLDGAESVLDEWTGHGYERLADAQQADDRVRSFIGGTLPGKGATRLGHRGLAQLLWIPQDPARHDLPDFAGPPRERLLALVGATTLGPEEDALVEKIKDAHDFYFTPGGKPKKGSSIWEAEQRLSNARAELERWQQAEREAAAIVEGLAGTESELKDLEAEERTQAEALKQARERANAEADLERQLVVKRGEQARLEERFKDVEAQRRALAELGAKIATAREAAAALAPRLNAAHLAVEEHKRGRETAAAVAEAARSVLAEAEARLERGRTIEQALRVAGDRRRLREVVEKAGRIAAEVLRKRAEPTTPAPGEAEVRHAEALAKQIAQAEAQLEVVGLKVMFTSERAATVTWTTSDGHEEKRPDAGDHVVFHGTDDGTLSIAAVGVIQIKSGAKDVSVLKTKLDDSRRELARRLGERAAKDVEALRGMLETARTREQDVAGLERKLSDVLTGDHEDLESARRALRTASGRLAELLAQLGLDEAGLAAEQGADARVPVEDVKAAKERLAAREQGSKQAEAALREAEKQLAGLEQERVGHEREARTLETERAAIVAAEGTLDGLAAEAIRLAGDASLAAAAASAIETKLPAPDQRASAIQPRIEAARERIAQRDKETRARFTRGMTLLERAGAEGAYSRLCEAEEKVALLEANLARERRKAEAARLLQNLAEAQRHKASRSLVDPVEKEVRARLEYLRGQAAPRMALAFAEGLSAVEVVPPGGAPVPLSALSWGAREQTMFALRLALGAMLSRGGQDPQLVILDDALVNADPQRHGRALDLIQSAAEQMQVVILTAFPDRYRALRAQEVDLAALARG